MFDIRKIQEQVIYQAVKDKSNEDVAKAIVFGSDEPEKKEDNSMGQSDDGTAGKPVRSGHRCADQEKLSVRLRLE